LLDIKSIDIFFYIKLVKHKMIWLLKIKMDTYFETEGAVQTEVQWTFLPYAEPITNESNEIC
jgi:hypothetical protein